MTPPVWQLFASVASLSHSFFEMHITDFMSEVQTSLLGHSLASAANHVATMGDQRGQSKLHNWASRARSCWVKYLLTLSLTQPCQVPALSWWCCENLGVMSSVVGGNKAEILCYCT